MNAEQQALLAEIKANQGTLRIPGSKSRKTKSHARYLVALQLTVKGLITVRTLSDSYLCRITEQGTEAAKTLPAPKLSEAQVNRRNARDRSGRYEEMNTCDLCQKRKAVVYWYDEISGIACEKCIEKYRAEHPEEE